MKISQPFSTSTLNVFIPETNIQQNYDQCDCQNFYKVHVSFEIAVVYNNCFNQV